MACPVRVALAIVSVFACLSSRSRAANDPSALQTGLQQLADDALAVSSMQREYDRYVSRQFRSDDGEKAAATLARSLSNTFQKRELALNKLSAAARQAYQSFSTSSALDRCCDVADSSVYFDSRFNATVTRTRSCDRIPTASTRVDSISPALQSIFDSNLNDIPELKWQYFGSESGYSTFFPSRNLSTCYDYDPRYRPWYVAAASPQPKDIVIVLDTSGSMQDPVAGSSGSRLDLAKAAVIAVLDTLYPTDEVGLVEFNSNQGTPNGCFGSGLAKATPLNIQTLKKYVNGLSPSGSTYYSKGLSKAYNLISTTMQARLNAGLTTKTSSRNQVILFVSDGKPQDGTSIRNTLRDGNTKVDNRVVIMSFAVGNLDSSEQRYLQDLADGTQKKGLFQHIPSFLNVREKLARYYTFFEDTTSPTVYSMPYFDGLGLGLVITLATPIKFDKELKGVMAVDVSVNDVLSEVAYYASGENQYAFIIDELGHAVIHPMLPVPLDVHSDPVFHNIKLFETDVEFVSIYNSMMRRETGNLTYSATRYIRRGNSKYEGTEKVKVMSSYFWSPVNFTNYVVCIVLTMEDQSQTTPMLSEISFSKKTIYHRFDLVKPTSHLRCSQFGHLAIKDASCVKFAPEAFRSPSRYLNVPETAETVDSYVRYLDDTGKSQDNVYFKSTVRNSVRLTVKADSYWKTSAAAKYQSSLVWRYIATMDGVFRLIPGSQLALAWDPFQRGWFTRALNNVGKNVLSTPYLDGFGAGYVITMAHTIQMDSRNASSPVGAVMGVDFTMGYIWKQISLLYPECAGKTPRSRCFLMDQHGYLVIHPDFVQNAEANPAWVHLVSKEPLVASELIRENILVRQSCANYEQRQRFFSYEVNPASAKSVIRSCYQIHAVENSNVYLGIISTDSSCAVRVTCSSCSGNINNLAKCNGAPVGKSCHCPCWLDLTYFECSNTFPAEGFNVCPPEVLTIPVPPRVPSATRQLEQCFNGFCSNITKSTDCDATVGCNWCAFSDDRTELEQAHCASDLTCFGGVQGKCNPQRDCSGEGGDKKGSSSSSSVAGPVVGSIFAVIFVLALIGFFCHKNKKSSAPRSAQNDELRTVSGSTRPSDFPSSSAQPSDFPPSSAQAAVHRPSVPSAPEMPSATGGNAGGAATAGGMPPPPGYDAAMNMPYNPPYPSSGYGQAAYPSAAPYPSYPASTASGYPPSGSYPEKAPYPPS